MGSLMSGGPPSAGINRPGSLLSSARAARAAGVVPTPDPNAGHWIPDPNYMGDRSPPMLFVLDNPTPAPAAAAPTGAVPAMQQAVQAAAAAAAPVGAQVNFPVPPTVLGTLGETATATGGTASTAPTSRRRRAPTRGRNATLLSGSEIAETLGA